MTRFQPSADGVEIRLGAAEVAILSRLPALLGSVGADPDDPALGRLQPHAYPDDTDDSLELIRLTMDDIAAARSADLDVFGRQLTAALAGIEITPDDAEAWLRVLGAARIVLAARRGLFEVEDLSAVSGNDPDVALVNLLGVYQQSLTEVLLMSMRTT